MFGAESSSGLAVESAPVLFWRWASWLRCPESCRGGRGRCCEKVAERTKTKPAVSLSSMTVALIVAAGKGTRMGPGSDKLFLELNGKPVVAHTWQTFDRAVSIKEIVIVVR